MSKDFAWELFKNTGNVDAFMIMRNIESDLDYKKKKKKEESNVSGDIDGSIKN